MRIPSSPSSSREKSTTPKMEPQRRSLIDQPVVRPRVSQLPLGDKVAAELVHLGWVAFPGGTCRRAGPEIAVLTHRSHPGRVMLIRLDASLEELRLRYAELVLEQLPSRENRIEQ